MAWRVLTAELSGGWVRGRQRLGWMDVVKVALSNRGLTVEAARQCTKIGKSGESWYIVTEGVSCGHFCLALFSFGPPSRALEGVDVPPEHVNIFGEGRDATTWCSWDKLWKGCNYLKSRLWCQVYGLRHVSLWLYVCFIWLDMTTPPFAGRKSWYIIIILW